MQSEQEVFIVLEGADGSGKATQFKLLAERLKAVGYLVEVFDFPQYEKSSSYFVRQYLNGAYGPASSVSPYTASLFYALDRYEAALSIQNALKQGKVVLSNRYVGSNMAHQGSKFNNPVEQRGFFLWADALEYNMLGIPRPTLNLFLKVPAETSFELIHKKAVRNYTQKSHDEHEADIGHLRRSVGAYDLLSKLFPKDFQTIECTQDGELMSIPEISNKIWNILQPILPPRPRGGGRTAIVKLSDLTSMSPPPSTIKAAPSNENRKNEAMNLKISSISMLTAGVLLGANGIKVRLLGYPTSRQSFYQLPRVDKQLASRYREVIDEIKKIEEEAITHLRQSRQTPNQKTRSALKLMTPMSTLVDVEIQGKEAATHHLIKTLKGRREEEMKWLSGQLFAAAQKARPEKFKNHTPDMEGSDDYVSLFMDGSVSSRGVDSSEPVKLVSVWPRNEFELLAESIYAKADLPREEIISEVESWPYERKWKALSALTPRNLPASQIVYRFDVVASYQAVEPLITRGLINDVTVQSPTARYGYDVPVELETAKLDDLFIESFDKSLELYSIFQSSGHEDLAGYTTLLGHRRRWMFTVTYEGINKMKEVSGLDIDDLTNQILEKASAIHPIIFSGEEKIHRVPTTNSPRNKKIARPSQRKAQ